MPRPRHQITPTDPNEWPSSPQRASGGHDRAATLREMTREATVINSSKFGWTTGSTDLVAVIGSVRGSAALLRILPTHGMSTVSGRIAGAPRHRVRDADEILSSLSAAGHTVLEESPST